MNENINLCEILKNVPKGTKLWSPLFGDVCLECIENDEENEYPVKVSVASDGAIGSLTSDGRFFAYYTDTECALFPSKDQRDWSKFQAPEPAPVAVRATLHPYDRVLVRDEDKEEWGASLFSHYDSSYAESYGFVCLNQEYYRQCVPYNEDTAHLLGTKDACQIHYELEFSKEY